MLCGAIAFCVGNILLQVAMDAASGAQDGAVHLCVCSDCVRCLPDQTSLLRPRRNLMDGHLQRILAGSAAAWTASVLSTLHGHPHFGFLRAHRLQCCVLHA